MLVSPPGSPALQDWDHSRAWPWHDASPTLLASAFPNTPPDHQLIHTKALHSTVISKDRYGTPRVCTVTEARKGCLKPIRLLKKTQARRISKYRNYSPPTSQLHSSPRSELLGKVDSFSVFFPSKQELEIWVLKEERGY